MKIRIGVVDSQGTIELELEDGSPVVEELEEAFREGRQLLQFTDVEGRLVMIPLDKLAYLEVGPEKARWVGFAKAE